MNTSFIHKSIAYILAILFFPLFNMAQNYSQSWVQLYLAGTTSTGASVVADAFGNTYAAGNVSTSSGQNFLLTKYNASGAIHWAKRYLPTGAINATAKDMAMDHDGNLVITGRAIFTVNANTTSGDYYTIKCDTAGTLIWEAIYNVNNGSAMANAVAIDGNNNIYITGNNGGTSTSNPNDIATIKYNANGVQQWVSVYNYADDGGNDIVVKGEYVYVTGGTSVTGSTGDAVTIKYQANNGSVLWSNRYSTSNSVNERCDNIRLDDNDNVYVSGLISSTSNNNVTTSDWLIIKYNASGSQQWVRNFDGPGENTGPIELAIDMAIDYSGNLVVVGRSTVSVSSGKNKVTSSLDIGLAKYNGSGTLLWSAFYGVSTNSETGNAVFIDANNTIYVSGCVTGKEVYLLSYAPTGNLNWVLTYSGTGGGFIAPGAITEDNAGNLVVCGYSSGTPANLLVIKYARSLNKTGNSSTAIANNIRYHYFKVSPNPALDKITLSSDQAVIGNIIIFDQSGRMVFERFVTSDSEEIDLTPFSPGIYYLRNDTNMVKIVKQ